MLDCDPTRMPRGIRFANLCKHLFVCGMPGGGKTTAIASLLLQLHARGIPWLVIEAAKTEYRTWAALRRCGNATAEKVARTVRVYTPGMEHLSPMRFNPLWRPHSVEVHEHIDQVLRCFNASIPMMHPLPALLGESLEAVFRNRPHSDCPPTIDQLIEAARVAVESKGYSATTKGDLLGALEVRLGMLGRRTVGQCLRSSACIPSIAEIVSHPCVIELDHVESEIKALLTLLLLTAIRQHVRTHPWRRSDRGHDPRLVIVIEEAHNIVGRSSDGPSVDGTVDPKASATELICRMLAEFRALGVGLVVVDQLPCQVAPQVIKTTGTKLTFQEVDHEERETLASAMLFGSLEFDEIARLAPGQAYLFGEGYHRAHRIRTVNLADRIRLGEPPDNAKLLRLVRSRTWFKRNTNSRIADALERHQSELDVFRDHVTPTLHKSQCDFTRPGVGGRACFGASL